MTEFTPLIAAHAIAALVVILLGPIQIFRPRRDRAHRLLGRNWASAMVVTCVTSLFIHPDGFTWLHGLALFTLASVTIGIIAIRRGSVVAHRANMIGSYLGTLAAFGFAALIPQRLIQTTLRQDPVTILAVTLGAMILVAAWSLGVIRTTSGATRDEKAAVSTRSLTR